MNRSQTALAAVLFAVAYTQPLALYSNQHQYFLHAAARAGVGDLGNDWLANTTDPTPVFSSVVAFTMKHAGLWPTHAACFAAAAGYFLGVFSVVKNAGLLPRSAAGQWLLAALFTATQCAISRYASDRLLGADYPWFLQCGLANQYLLGPGLQPSVIGVLLLASLALFAAGRTVAAAALAAAVNLVHATYLLPSALLVAGYLAADLRAGRTRSACIAAAVALAVVAPAAVYAGTTFGTLPPKAHGRAMEILAYLRIPHHTRPARWFDVAGGGQLVLLAAGLVAFRRTVLFVPFAVAGTIAVVLSVIAILVENPEFSLLFPWRISAALVPLSTAALLAAAARYAERFPKPCGAIAATVSAAAVAGAGAVYGLNLGYREPPSEEAVLEYVRETAKPGDLYLIPARFPKPNPPAGVYSATFSRPPGETAVVYFELARFRLATGACLFVDFKSIPYRDDEVLEWHRRVTLCVQWFGNAEWTPELVAAVKNEGVTHVVAPAAMNLRGEGLELLTRAGAYTVYRLK